jgi:hypothetical protein
VRDPVVRLRRVEPKIFVVCGLVIHRVLLPGPGLPVERRGP